MNLIIKLIVIAYAIVCYSCNNNKSFVTHKIDRQISPLFKMTDTLVDVFRENQFKQTIDTFKLAGKDLPECIAIIEYDGMNADEPRNMKCLLLRYANNKGVFCLFKYSIALGGWELIAKYSTSSARLETMKAQILNADYWNGYKDKDAITLWGDKARYIVLDTHGKDGTSIMKYTSNPDMRLLDMFIDFTVSLKNEKFN